MGEYGSGTTLTDAFAMDKERIGHALDGELIVGEDENGFVYGPAPEEECREYILSVFDNAVYQCLQINAAAKALEKMLRKHAHFESERELLNEFGCLKEEALLDTWGYK